MKPGNRKLIAFFISMAVFTAISILTIIKGFAADYTGLGTAVMFIAGPFYASNAWVHAKGKEEAKPL